MKKLCIYLLISAITGCSDSSKDIPVPGGTDVDPAPTTVTLPGKGTPGVVGTPSQTNPGLAICSYHPAAGLHHDEG